MWSPQIYSRESSWTPHGLLMDSTWSLWRLLETSRKCFHGFPWSPHGVHVDSLGTPQSLHGLRGNPWGSVKPSSFVRPVLQSGQWQRQMVNQIGQYGQLEFEMTW